MALSHSPSNPTTNPGPEERHVVIEPPQTPQPRLKQYVALEHVEIDKDTSAKAFELVWITEATALPYLSAQLIVPLDVAIRQGIYPAVKETPAQKLTEKVKQVVKEVVGGDATSTPRILDAETESLPKTVFGNKLRDAVQEKKAEAAKIDPAKLAAIKAGGGKNKL